MNTFQIVSIYVILALPWIGFFLFGFMFMKHLKDDKKFLYDMKDSIEKMDKEYKNLMKEKHE